MTLLIACAGRALGQTAVWNGGAGDWFNPANWSTGVVPLVVDVQIDGGKTGVTSAVSIRTNTEVNNLTIDVGGSRKVPPTASRSVWSGFIRFSLVAVPVKAFTAAASGGGDISLNQLHKGCNSRIQYKKTCPIHGEVKTEEIVSGPTHYNFDDTLEEMGRHDEAAVHWRAYVAESGQRMGSRTGIIEIPALAV
jgi:hypothetical protein